MQDYQTALRAIVKILSPKSPLDFRRSLAVLLAEAGNGKIHENLVFYYWHIGALFHPNDAAAAAALTDKVKTARESYELQSIVPRDMGGILAGDLLTWPECPPVTAENPLSFWLPVSDAHSGAPEKAAPPAAEARTHRIGTRANALNHVIEKAKLAASDSDDYQCVWAELVKLADSSTRPAPLLGYSEGEGLKYQDYSCIRFLTKKALKQRMNRSA